MKIMSIVYITIVLAIVAAVSGIAILASIVPPSENIILSCNSDEDCHKTCYGCVNKASFVEQDCTPSESLCKCIHNVCQYIINEQDAIEIVDEKFPEREKTATLVDEEDPYWNVSFTANGTSVSVSVSGGGEIIGESCSGAACDGCQYEYTEITPWGEIIYNNYGCDNPLPACDISNICRPCESDSECLVKTASSTIRLDIGQIITQYYYSLTGTGITAHYNESSSICEIHGIYSDVLDIVECEEEILSHVTCTGQCAPN